MKIKLRRKYTAYKIDGGGTPKCIKGGKTKTGNNPQNNPKVIKHHSILWHLNAAMRKRGQRENANA
jgi:hypothetical protein